MLILTALIDIVKKLTIRPLLFLPALLLVALLPQSCIKDPVIYGPGDTVVTKKDTIPKDTVIKDTVIKEPVKPVQYAWNVDKLVQWNAWKTNQTSSFDWLLIGDSYTQGSYFAGLLRDSLLLNGYQDGGAGYCSFGRFDPSQLYSIDSSIDPEELTFTYDITKWHETNYHTVGPCGHVTNSAANALITVTANAALNSMTILYERHPGAGTFRYRVNRGAWTIVNNSNTVQDVDNVVVDVSGAGNTVTLDIQALNEGQIFCGVLGRRTGNVLNVHKVGSSGSIAGWFGKNDAWTQSVALLKPKAVAIMFGTNEMNLNVSPDEMKADLQNIINKVRTLNPACDILLMSPLETMWEKEDPRTYKFAEYSAMVYKLALDNNAAYINHSLIMGHFSQELVDKGLMSTDRIHPTVEGGKILASNIYKILKK